MDDEARGVDGLQSKGDQEDGEVGVAGLDGADADNEREESFCFKENVPGARLVAIAVVHENNGNSPSSNQAPDDVPGDNGFHVTLNASL